MAVKPDRPNKTQFLPSRGRVDTTIWMHYTDANETDGEKASRQLHKIGCEQYWTSPGSNTLQSSSDTATNHLSRKLSKLDEPDVQDNAGEVGKSS